jgi:hypothetical protein
MDGNQRYIMETVTIKKRTSQELLVKSPENSEMTVGEALSDDENVNGGYASV